MKNFHLNEMIRLKNFEKQKVIFVSDVVAMVEAIPVEHLKGLKYIVYDPARYYQRSYVAPVIPDRNVKGQYFSEMADAIIIYEINSIRTFEHILLHEIGHFVFNRILAAKDRNYWVTKLYTLKSFVSDYAKTNAQEDFAETYAFYMKGHQFGYSLQAKYQFLLKKFP